MKNKDELVTAVFERIREQKEARTKSRRRALLIVVTLAFTAAIGVFAVIAFRPERAPGPAFPAEQSAVSQEEASATASAASSEAGSAVPADMSKDEPQPETSTSNDTPAENDEVSGSEIASDIPHEEIHEPPETLDFKNLEDLYTFIALADSSEEDVEAYRSDHPEAQSFIAKELSDIAEKIKKSDIPKPEFFNSDINEFGGTYYSDSSSDLDLIWIIDGIRYRFVYSYDKPEHSYKGNAVEKCTFANHEFYLYEGDGCFVGSIYADYATIRIVIYSNARSDIRFFTEQDHGNESEPPEPFGELPDSFAEHEAVLRPLLAGTLAKPVFPAERTGITKDAATGLENCFSAMTRQFLSSPDGKNKVYSPLNIYFALAMLAETAKGDTRAQIVSLLGAESMDSLREQAQTLWENHYKDEELSRVLLGSSIWLNDDDAVQYDQAVIDLLARIYYASAFSGDPLDPEFSAQYRDWINANTFDLLKNKIDNKNLPDNMRFCICTTAYYKSSWRDAFSYVKSDTALVFHAPGKDVVCDKFMFSRWNSAAPDSFYAGNRFKAMSKPLECGKMYFILPDEGVSADDLLADNEALAYISGGGGRAYGSNAADPDELCICELTVPAFRVDYDRRSEKSWGDGLLRRVKIGS